MEQRLAAGSFFGQKTGSRHVSGYTLLESVYAPDVVVPRHSHENAYFCFVLQGMYSETYGQRTRLCEPGSLTFHPQGEVHSDRFHADASHLFNLEIDSSGLKRLGEFSTALSVSTDWQGGASAWCMARLYHEFRQRDAVSILAVEGLILELLAEVVRHRTHLPNRVPSWLKQAKEIVHARFLEPLTLYDIAQAVNIHPVHLSRVFRQAYQYTITDYVRRLRIDFACVQLARTDYPLGEIAITAGFSDQSHFTRTFKGLMGLTPGQYRATLSPHACSKGEGGS